MLFLKAGLEVRILPGTLIIYEIHDFENQLRNLTAKLNVMGTTLWVQFPPYTFMCLTWLVV